MNCTPQDLINQPKWFIVDIREREERYDDLGFIPGSLWIPLSDDSFNEQLLALAAVQPVALVCLGGHRSDEVYLQLHQLAKQATIFSLKGGLLGWRGCQLPTSGLNHQFTEHPDGLDVFAHIRACFVAQMTETMLDNEEHEAFENPMTLLNTCFEEQGTTPDNASIQQWYHVLDRLAHVSKSKGTKLSVVQEHLDDFINILPKP